MPQWCDKHQMHTSDEVCPSCQQEREAPAKRIAALGTQLSDARKEEELNAALLLKLSDLLTRTVNEIKGQPPELTQWSHHDLPEMVKELK